MTEMLGKGKFCRKRIWCGLHMVNGWFVFVQHMSIGTPCDSKFHFRSKFELITKCSNIILFTSLHRLLACRLSHMRILDYCAGLICICLILARFLFYQIE